MPTISFRAPLTPNLGDRLHQVEQDNRRLQERLQVCLEELGTLSRGTGRSASVLAFPYCRQSNPLIHSSKDEERTLKKQPSMKWAPITKPTNSPTRPVPDGVASDSPHASPQQAEHEIPVRISLFLRCLSSDNTRSLLTDLVAQALGPRSA